MTGKGHGYDSGDRAGRNSAGAAMKSLQYFLRLLLPDRLSAVERRLIWEQGPGLELRENSAAISLLGLAVMLILATTTEPFMRWMCSVSG